MVKNLDENKRKTKKIIKILLLSPIILLGLLILYIIAVYATSPIFDKIEQNKYEQLDTGMQNLFSQIKSNANEGDDWKYAAVCNDVLAGDFPTGQFNCVTSISLQKTITSVDQLNSLQAKYYPIIDGGDTLTTKTELDPELPGDFGENFVVSSAEKNYMEKSGVECRYLIKLNQSADEYDFDYDSYGSEIIDDRARLVISLRCDGVAREAWYEVDGDTSMLIP